MTLLAGEAKDPHKSIPKAVNKGLLHAKKNPFEVLKNNLSRYAVVWIRILLFYIVSIFCMCCLVSQTDPRLLSPEHSVVEVRMKGTQSLVRFGH